MDKFSIGVGKKYKSKPSGIEIACSKKKAINNYDKYSIDEIAKGVGEEGCSFIPALLVGGMKKENFKSIQLFALDFDDAEKCSFRSVMERSRYFDLPVAFAYRTLSCNDVGEPQKYRVVYVFETVVDDSSFAFFIYHSLQRIFPEADSACIDLARIFLGGKGLLYEDDYARVKLVNLLNTLYSVLDDDNHHFLRNLRSFMKKVPNIDIINNQIVVGYVNQMSIFGANLDPANIKYLGESTNAPIFYLKRESGKNINFHQNNTCSHVSRIDFDNIAPTCKLFNDFSLGKELNHQERFLIFTNLLNIQGGLKLFYDILEKNYDEETVSKWRASYKYCKNYHPMSCKNNCPYCEACSKECEEVNIVLRLLHDKKIIVKENEKYVPIEAAFSRLCDNLTKAVKSRKEEVHMIKAQTALGKTTAIRKIINDNPDKRFLIAEPTNILKKEVYDDLLQESVEVDVTDSVRDSIFISEELKQQYFSLHERGFHVEAKKVIVDYLNEFIKENPECRAKIENLTRIVESPGKLNSRVIVTTHAKLLTMDEIVLNSFDEVIIDEDILYLQILSQNCSVSVDTLKNNLSAKDKIIAEVASEMLKAKEGCFYEATWFYPQIRRCDSARDDDLDDEFDIYDEDEPEESFCIGENLNDTLIAGAYVKLKNTVYYMPRKDFKRRKYIILSATYDSDVYRHFFKKQGMELVEYPSDTVKYKGCLKQAAYYSLGRGMLKKEIDIFSKVRQDLGRDIPILTFKCMELELQGKISLNNENIHFGNAIGVNCFKGKDLVIVGTPYMNELAYKLPVCFLYGPQAVPKAAKMNYRRIEYNGKSFLITTYSTEELQRYHMYSLESELEQCVGRARLLRYDCTVYVLSSFPCNQAQINIDDYLKEDSKPLNLLF